MVIRWTRRRNKRLMTTIRFEAHVDQAVVRWIQGKTGWSEAWALRWLKREYEDGLSTRQHRYTPAVVDGELRMIHWDVSETTQEDGGEVYGA